MITDRQPRVPMTRPQAHRMAHLRRSHILRRIEPQADGTLRVVTTRRTLVVKADGSVEREA